MCIVVNMTMTMYRENGTVVYDIQDAVSQGFWASIVNQMLTGTLSSRGIIAIRLHDMISGVTKDLSTSSTSIVRKREEDITKDEMSSDSMFELSRFVGSLILVVSTIFLVIGIKKKVKGSK